MGLFKKGMLDGVSGKVGTIIGATWRTLNVIKSLPTKSNKPPVQSQIDQRFIFALVTAFLAKAKNAVNVGFRSNTGPTTPMNAAVSYNIENAVTGVSPVFSIDYASVALSHGSLPIGYNAAMVASAGYNLNVTWDATVGLHESDPDYTISQTDKAILVIYNPTRKQFMRISTATRVSAALAVKLNFVFAGENHVYLFFAQATGKDVSDTQYLGKFTALA
jgi:hypothetical protein